MAKSKKKSTSVNKSNQPTYKYLDCKLCGNSTKVGYEAVGVTCSSCASKMIPWPEDKTYKASGKPRGWAFMKVYVDKDGTVFHKGEEQLDLKGTLSPTKIKKVSKVKIKVSKREKEEQQLKTDMDKRRALKEKDSPFGKDIRLFRVIRRRGENISNFYKDMYTYALVKGNKFRLYNGKSKDELINQGFTKGNKNANWKYTTSPSEYKADKGINFLFELRM